MSIEKIGRCKIDSDVTFNIGKGSKIIIGDRVRIRKCSYIEISGGTVVLQNGVVIGPFNFIQGNGGIVVGQNTITGPSVTLLSSRHQIGKHKSINGQRLKPEKLIIQNDVWIGASSTIQCGIIIGEGSVIGANSFVNKDIPPYEVWGGVPAKFLKARK